jgi:hypothetical protein
MPGKLVIDGRNALDPQAVRAAGFAFEGIGRGAGREAAPGPLEPEGVGSGTAP